jgi:hypothetical protein
MTISFFFVYREPKFGTKLVSRDGPGLGTLQEKYDFHL